MKIFEIFFNKMQKNAWQIYWNRVLYTSTVRVSAVCGPVAQLVRAPACHAGGRRFEPVLGRHKRLGSSVGRAADWKSACRWFNSAPRHQTHAGVAQWQSSWFVISRLWVRVQSPAPQRKELHPYMGRFQSGQMDQTVNLTSSTSVVRIHLCPPKTYNPNQIVITSEWFGFTHYLSK